jgi:hypothetical protein
MTMNRGVETPSVASQKLWHYPASELVIGGASLLFRAANK